MLAKIRNPTIRSTGQASACKIVIVCNTACLVEFEQFVGMVKVDFPGLNYKLLYIGGTRSIPDTFPTVARLV